MKHKRRRLLVVLRPRRRRVGRPRKRGPRGRRQYNSTSHLISEFDKMRHAQASPFKKMKFKALGPAIYSAQELNKFLL